MQRRKQNEYESFVFQSEGTFTFPSLRPVGAAVRHEDVRLEIKKRRHDDLDEPERKYHTASPFSPRQQMLVFKPDDITCSR